MSMAAMASTDFAPTLEATAADDDMEILSDAGRMDHDLDIDIDATGSHAGEHDIDYMLEDTKDYPEGGQHDDLMLDEIDPNVFAEDDMADNGVVADEHLTDAVEPTQHNFSDDASVLEHETTIVEFSDSTEIPQVPELEPDDSPTAPTEARDADRSATVQPPQSDLLQNTVNLGSELHELHDDDTLEDVSGGTEGLGTANQNTLEIEAGAAPKNNSTSNSDEHSPSLPQVDHRDEPQESMQDGHDASAVDRTPAENVAVAEQDVDHKEEDTAAQVSASAGLDDQPSVTLAEATSNDHNDNAHSQQQQPESVESNSPNFNQDSHSLSLVALHPVLVEYEHDEISLFPPSEEDGTDTYLLHDPLLAYGSMSELFEACRQVLGESIDEEHVLEMSMEQLGLSISEDSNDCSSTSMYQIIDVFLHLQRNDGVEHPDPLYATLTIKPIFSSRLKMLLRAATESKGFTELPTSTQSVVENQHDEDQKNEETDGSKDYEEGGEMWRVDGNEDRNEDGNEDGNEDENEDENETEASQYAQAHQDEHAQEIDAATADESNYSGSREEVQPESQGEEEEGQEREAHHEQEPELTNTTTVDPAEDPNENSSTRIPDPVQEQAEDQTVEETELFGEDDLIDYSDDEAKEEEAPTSGSSTVQGEQASNGDRQYTRHTNNDDWLIDHYAEANDDDDDDDFEESAATESGRKFSVPDDDDDETGEEVVFGETSESQAVHVPPTGDSARENLSTESGDDYETTIPQGLESSGHQPAMFDQSQATDEDKLVAFDESTEYQQEWNGDPSFEDEEELFDNEEADWEAYNHNNDEADAVGVFDGIEAFHDDDETEHQDLEDGDVEAKNHGYETVDLEEGETVDGEDAHQQKTLESGGSPAGKRSWEELIEDDVPEGTEKESKRVRSR